VAAASDEPKNSIPDEERGRTRSAVRAAVDGTSNGADPDPLIGLVFSRYRVDERLAAGGMGVLYRATDLKLARRVVIKILSPQLAADGVARARFEREARAASALDHPNIATVHDIGEERGELFIVLALYEGETLEQRLKRGALPIDQAVGILKQVALGLEAAHRAGIVHRDIKPSNVLVTTDGVVKILDFGVAKLRSDAGEGTTQVGQTVGTVRYMSPEQMRGEVVDARSDLWSFGVLAYELLSGISPFRADSIEATATRVLNEELPSLASIPGMPSWLADLVVELLKKNPAERPQSASEVLRRLNGTTSAERRAVAPVAAEVVRPRGRPRILALALIAFAAMVVLVVTGVRVVYHELQQRRARVLSGAIKSLVVLPFLNATANPDTEYLSDGIAESLIDNLSQMPELRVIARNTAFRYKGKDVDVPKLRRELAVDAVLTGQVRQRGDTLVVHADLINLNNGSELWGERYSRRLTDLLSLEEEIAKSISDKLRPRLAPEVQRRVTKLNTEDTEAYQLYLRGRFFWNKRTKESLNKGIEYFQRAVERDPKYALAYAGLADSYTMLAYYSFAPFKETSKRAEAAAQKALSLDDGLAEAHAALGNIRMMNWDWQAAETNLKRAIELNPNYAPAHNWLGLYWTWIGHPQQAMQEYTRAQQLDPSSAIYIANLATAFCSMGEYDRGVAQLKECLLLEPGFPLSRIILAVGCYAPRKMYREAIDELKQAMEFNPAEPSFLGPLAWLYSLSGDRDRARTLLKQLEERDGAIDLAAAVAGVYFSFGDKDHGFEWLEKSYQRHSRHLVYLKMAPVAEDVRNDPRFKDLVRRVGFPP
jgi:serine/threonine-protein kinase